MPQYRMPWEPMPPPQEEVPPPNLLREAGKWFVGQSGEDLDRAMAMQELRAIEPDLQDLYEIQEKHAGKKRSAQELYTDLRQLRSPGWEGPSGGEKALGLGLFAGQYPVAGALGAVAPGLGHVAGWGAMRHMAHLANPEMAGASLAWDVAGAGVAKTLGTAGSMLYRSKVMPKLAEKGLTSKELHPAASRVLDWAEGAMDPLIGPKARNVGLPRWANRRLQKMGRRDIVPEPPTARLPAGQQELGLPGQQTFPGMRPRVEGEAFRPTRVTQPVDMLAYKSERRLIPAWKKPATTGKKQEDIFRTALEELPPEPEQLTTLSEVAQGARAVPWLPEQPQAVSQALMGRAADKIVSVVKPGETLTWKGYAKGLQTATGLPRKEMVGVLRIHKALASSYGETPDEMVGRMFRGVMTQEEHVTTFPGVSKWAGGAQGPAGVAHWMEDGRAVLAFSDRVRMGQVKTATQLETALHEPLHVFYKWMPERERAVLSKALGAEVGQGWSSGQEHQAITWALEYMRSGQAPTKTLAKTFERFKSWLNRLLTKGKKGRGPKEVEEVLARMLTPGGYKERVQKPVLLSRGAGGKSTVGGGKVSPKLSTTEAALREARKRRAS